MKKFIVAFAIYCAIPAYASDDSVNYCNTLGNIAKVVMNLRQNGVSVMDLYEQVGGYSEAPPVTRLLIQDAYEQSRFLGDEYKQRAVSEFSSKWFLACLEAKEEN